MRLQSLALVAACATLLSAPAVARAQANFYDLDDDRPTLIEDAYVTSRGGIEVQQGLGRFERHGRRNNTILLHTEVNYGAWYNLQVGAAGRAVVGQLEGTAVSGFSDSSAFALYNFNRESPYLPAFAVRGDAAFPTGPYSAQKTRGIFKVMMTRSFGRLRLHVNAAYGAGPGPKTSFATDLAARWWAGGVFDYPLTFNFLWLLETYAIRYADAPRVDVNSLMGFRWQVSPRWVLDAGVGRGWRPDGNQLTITVGVTANPGAFGL